MAEKPTLTPERIASRRPDIRIRKFRGKLFVSSGANALELDEVAAFIFSQIDGVSTVQQIGERVAREYDVSVAEAVADSAELLTQLVEAEVVEARDP